MSGKLTSVLMALGLLGSGAVALTVAPSEFGTSAARLTYPTKPDFDWIFAAVAKPDFTQSRTRSRGQRKDSPGSFEADEFGTIQRIGRCRIVGAGALTARCNATMEISQCQTICLRYRRPIAARKGPVVTPTRSRMIRSSIPPNLKILPSRERLPTSSRTRPTRVISTVVG